MKIKLPMTGLYRSKTQWYDNGRLLGDWNRIIQKGRKKLGRIYCYWRYSLGAGSINTENFPGTERNDPG